MRLLLLMFVLLVASLGAQPQQPASSAPAAGSSLDFEFFKTRVQPIFLVKRPGHARCISCHENGTPRIELNHDTGTFTEEQSRQNFTVWQRVVVAGDPEASRLLMHPLAKSAGGDPFHAGGRHWQSKNDPEWQTLAAWVRTGSQPAAQTTSAAGLDFETYRTKVEPIFLKERAIGEGAGMCVNCHSRIATRLRLQPLAEGARTWTEAQSRQNFEAVKRVVVAGDPAKSALAIHPLAPSAGGDQQHTGGKFWTAQDNPEYQAVVAWVKAAAPVANANASATPTLDFEYFKTRVQPIFLVKRPGHARCISCHENGTPRIELNHDTGTFTEAQSRQNFTAWQRVVVAGDPEASRLLMHPLSKAVGGDPFHAGGRHWQSKSDPEWQMLAAWVRGEKATPSSR